MDIAPPEPASVSQDAAWHLDKRVPLAMIGALALQTFGIAWWAAGVTFRLDDHERRVASLERTEAVQTQQFATIAERLARIDERLVLLIQEHRSDRTSHGQP